MLEKLGIAFMLFVGTCLIIGIVLAMRYLTMFILDGCAWGIQKAFRKVFRR